MSLIFWDTMLFVYWVEEHPDYIRRMDHVYARMQERGDTLCTSVLTIGEVLTGPLKAGEKEMAERMRAALQPPVVEIVPFSEEAALRYAEIRATQNIQAADAVQLACAAQAGVDLFLTNDRNLIGKHIPGIQFIAALDTPIL